LLELRRAQRKLRCKRSPRFLGRCTGGLAIAFVSRRLKACGKAPSGVCGLDAQAGSHARNQDERTEQSSGYRVVVRAHACCEGVSRAHQVWRELAIAKIADDCRDPCIASLLGPKRFLLTGVPIGVPRRRCPSAARPDGIDRDAS
jgi:hypothetical protein